MSDAKRYQEERERLVKLLVAAKGPCASHVFSAPRGTSAPPPWLPRPPPHPFHALPNS